MFLKVGSPRLPGVDFWKSQGNFWESLDSQTSLNASTGVTVYKGIMYWAVEVKGLNIWNLDRQA